MGDLIQIVDSISATPTVLLNLNDEVTWSCPKFSAPAPRLRRSVSANAMRDGIYEGSSTYDSRVLALDLEVKTASQDTNATQLQLLARQLDRSDRYLKYQPTGATKPVFFKLFRSDTSAIDDVIAQVAMRRVSVELLAEPFALGLRETIGPVTVNNDPAHASNGCFFDVTGVIGDSPAPCVVQNTQGAVHLQQTLAVRQHGVPSDLVFFKQCESMTITDAAGTVNPGGGPDTAMSGTGTNNYMRTSFVSGAMISRLEWELATEFNTAARRRALRGTYRLVAVVRRNGTNVGTINIRWTLDAAFFGKSVAVQGTHRQVIDLGLISFQPPTDRAGYSAEEIGAFTGLDLQLAAERLSGTDTLDWDFVMLLPADECTAIFGYPVTIGGFSSGEGYLLDGVNESFASYPTSAGDPMGAGGSLRSLSTVMSGGHPRVTPGVSARWYLLQQNQVSAQTTPTKTLTSTLSVHYWPRYLQVRPSAT